MPQQRKGSRVAPAEVRVKHFHKPSATVVSVEETHKNIYNRKRKSHRTTTDWRSWDVTESKANVDRFGAEPTHLGLKLQVRHSKPPLDHPTQTDSDAAATSLMCPCSYVAKTGCFCLDIYDTTMNMIKKTTQEKY